MILPPIIKHNEQTTVRCNEQKCCQHHPSIFWYTRRLGPVQQCRWNSDKTVFAKAAWAVVAVAGWRDKITSKKCLIGRGSNAISLTNRGIFLYTNFIWDMLQEHWCVIPFVASLFLQRLNTQRRPIWVLRFTIRTRFAPHTQTLV